MESNVSYDSELGIIMAELKGQVTLDGLRLLSEDVLPMVANHSCLLLLSDVREVTAIKLSLADIYAIPKTLVDQFSCLGYQPYKVKRAVVVSGWSPLFSFFEDISNNRMMKTKVFLEMEPAKEWLFSQRCHDL
jgi:hypothetical protein